jgi:hypothetical protein
MEKRTKEKRSKEERGKRSRFWEGGKVEKQS